MKFDLADTAGLKLLTEAGDAERCWHIYSNPIAVDRPVAAWTALPLGLGVTETLMMLTDNPPEDEPEAAGIHEAYMTALSIRRDRALSAWHKHLAAKEGRSHVHH